MSSAPDRDDPDRRGECRPEAPSSSESSPDDADDDPALSDPDEAPLSAGALRTAFGALRARLPPAPNDKDDDPPDD